MTAKVFKIEDGGASSERSRQDRRGAGMNASEMPATKRQIRLIIKCIRDDDHQKLLKFDAELGMDYVETFAGLLCGTSPHYVHKPGLNSPIGKCATCGNQLEYTLEEREAPDAKNDRQHHEAGPGSL